MANLGILVLREVVGGLMVGHGTQKLFGWFGGFGLQGTGGWLESLGLRPGSRWAMLAGASEFGGGLLTLLGFLNPLGPLGIMGSMAMATAKVHWNKPIWVTAGGAELPAVNTATAAAIALAGPGAYSLDQVLGLRIPRWVSFASLGVGGALLFLGLRAGGVASPEHSVEEEAGGNLIAGESAEHPA